MPLSGSSRHVLRRSRRRFLAAYLCCIAFPSTAIAQGAQLSASLVKERAVVSIRMVETSEKLLVKNAYEGQVAQVRFDLRVYQRSRGLIGFFGDRIIQEMSIEKTGGWDPFTGRFFIRETNGETWSTARAEEYTGKLLSISDVKLEGISDTDEAYLLARIGLKQVRLRIPFNLLDPLLPETRMVTPWVRWDFNFGATQQ